MNNYFKFVFPNRSLFSSIATNASAIKKPARFYKEVNVQKFEREGKRPTFGIKLDNRILKSPAGRVLLLESEPLVRLIANEWEVQENEIKSECMHLNGLAFTGFPNNINIGNFLFQALDNPHSQTKQTLVSNLLAYLDGDTLLYFADQNNSLADEQKKNWTPIIEWINDKYQLDLKPTEDSTGLPNYSGSSKAKIERLFLNYNFSSLVAINYATEAIKSLILPIAVIAQHLDVKEAVNLAQLEQNYQTNVWGRFEWAHDAENNELCLRFSSSILFAYFSSNFYKY